MHTYTHTYLDEERQGHPEAVVRNSLDTTCTLYHVQYDRSDNEVGYECCDCSMTLEEDIVIIIILIVGCNE